MSFLDLPWEDIIYSKILPLITLKDCFNLCCASADFKILIENYLAHLKNVNNKEVLALNKMELKELANKTSHLEILHLESCKELTNEIIIEFLRNNSRTLTHLNVADTKIDVRAFHGIIHCRRLRQLILRNNLWVCSAFLLTVLDHLKSLLFIDINNCNQLDWKVTLWNLWYMSPELKCVGSDGQLLHVQRNKKRRQTGHSMEDRPAYSAVSKPVSTVLHEGWLLDEML